MKYAIYQINTERDKGRLLFTNYENVMKRAGRIPMEIYDKVHEGETKPVRNDDERTLEALYMEFNCYRHQHPEFRGRSLSVSDVVELPSGLWFCNSCGWQKVATDVGG